MTSKTPVYLDYAAATPLSKEAYFAMQPYLTDNFYNPSALYLSARAVRSDMEEARSRVAHELGARPAEIVFTAGGTEANNLAIHGVMLAHPGKRLLYSAIEHEAVIEPGSSYPNRPVSVDNRGLINLDELETAINDEVVLISVMYANNEIGVVQPIHEISELIAKKRLDRKQRGLDLPLYFHTDACQAASHLDLHVNRLGVDLMTINGGKIYGPKASGALYVRAGTKLVPFISGGGQERGLRSGTENVAAIIGFASAFGIARKKAPTEKKRLEILRSSLIRQLEETPLRVVVHGHRRRHLPHTLSVAIPGIDNERLMMTLDELGFMVATGSACSARNSEASHVLSAIGVSEDMARSTIRISLGRETTEADLRAFVMALEKAAKVISSLS